MTVAHGKMDADALNNEDKCFFDNCFLSQICHQWTEGANRE